MDEPRTDEPQLADWWARVGATLLDFVIIWLLFMASAIGIAIASVMLGVHDLGEPVFLVLAIVLGIGYYGGLMARRGERNGQTLGKQSADIRVVRDDGKPVTFGLGFLRDIVLKFGIGNAAFLVGWVFDSLWALGDREHRALHDLAVNTRVVRTRPRPFAAQIAARTTVAPRPLLAPPLARHVDEARRIEAAVRRMPLPTGEVSREIGALVSQLQDSAVRAQLLYEALADTPVVRVEQRLAALREDDRPELAGALREQLVVQRRMQAQLDRYDAELERMVVELDTVRANLVSVSASGDTVHQERLADAVRRLRDEMSAAGEGMDQAYRA